MKTVKVKVEDLLPLIEEAFLNNQSFDLTVKGTSMSPTFENGKTVVTITKYTGELKKNDVYLYKYENKILLHRLVKVKNNHFIFLGDSLYQKEYVSESDIIGVVTKVDQKPFVTSFKTKCYLYKRNIKSFIKRVL